MVLRLHPVNKQCYGNEEKDSAQEEKGSEKKRC